MINAAASQARVFFGFFRVRMMEFFSNKMDAGLMIMTMLMRVAIIGFLGVMVTRYADIPAEMLQGAPDYLSFLMIAQFVEMLIWTARGNISGFVLTDRFANLYMTPCSTPVIILAANSWKYAWTLMQALLFLVVGVLGFGMTFHLNWGLPAVILTGMLMLTAVDLAASGIRLVSKSGNDPVNWSITVTSQLLAGTMFPVEILPRWIRVFSYIHPQYYINTLGRRTIGGGASLIAVWPLMRGFLVTALVFLGLGLALFRWGFRRARLDGTLGHR